MNLKTKPVELAAVEAPAIPLPTDLPILKAETYHARLERTYRLMEEYQYDVLVVYGDREHFGNFQYLVGFEPRFEEGILIVAPETGLTAVLGNESLSLRDFAGVDVKAVLYPPFSLPNQPQPQHPPLASILRDAGLTSRSRVGLVGWKLFSSFSDKTFDTPAFIVEAIREVLNGGEQIHNATPLFMHPAYGLRARLEVEQMAIMEYGAGWASAGVHRLIQHLRPGVSELELADHLQTRGLPLSCHPMVSVGDKAKWGLSSPSSNRVCIGDPLTTALGIQGGLCSRAGYIVEHAEQLPAAAPDWLDYIVKPYFATAVAWYEAVGIGVRGGDLYDLVERSFPKERFGWSLNPGHLIAQDEWLSSPIYPESELDLQSGNALQMDIIPAPRAPYFGSNIEDGIVLADDSFQIDLQSKFPDVYERCLQRRTFMQNALGIELKPEVLPMSSIPAYLQPFLLNRALAMRVLPG